MFDKIEIINLALAKLSDGNTLQSLSENSPEAMQAQAHWDVAVRGVLSEFPWDFAKKQQRLNQLAEDVSLSAYEYHYAYPVNCILIRRVYSSAAQAGNVPFSTGLSFDGNQRIVMCNQEDAVAEYTIDAPPVTSFPVSFVNALAWRLAAEIALAIGRSNAGELLQAYAMTLNEAKLADAREVGPRSRVDGNWEKSRFPTTAQTAYAQPQGREG